jgi:CheY-like chemotaxis protein
MSWLGALVSRCGVVDVGASVEQAEPLLRRRLYDLIVLDIAMPGRTGIEWLHELRADGLGLWVSQSLVERYGGRISVGSLPGRGTRFAVWLRFEPLTQQ